MKAVSKTLLGTMIPWNWSNSPVMASYSSPHLTRKYWSGTCAYEGSEICTESEYVKSQIISMV